MTVQKLQLDAIRLDGGTQTRAAINENYVFELKDAIEEGAALPPVVIFHDGADRWLADGFHRYHATRQIGYSEIDAEVRQGTLREAILYAIGSNQAHGLRRSNADKQKAVKLLLADPEWSQWSDHEIAKRGGVSHPFVGKLRPQLETVSSSPIRKGADGKTRDVSKIGKTKPPAPVTVEPDIRLEIETGSEDIIEVPVVSDTVEAPPHDNKKVRLPENLQQLLVLLESRLRNQRSGQIRAEIARRLREMLAIAESGL